MDTTDFKWFADHGLYIFCFVKMDSKFYVIIDDKLPCLTDPNGNAIPFFARCENRNLFWVSLIEKAYAKLHTRYYALSGGSTAEALHDLTGDMVETCFIDNGKMTYTPVLFTYLKELSRYRHIVGVKIDLEMFPAMRQATKERLYADA